MPARARHLGAQQQGVAAVGRGTQTMVLVLAPERPTLLPPRPLQRLHPPSRPRRRARRPKIQVQPRGGHGLDGTHLLDDADADCA